MNRAGLVPRARTTLEGFGRAYAAILFCDSPRVGAWLALVTFFSPRAALMGVLALLAATAWMRLLDMHAAGPAVLVNALLCGLLMGAFNAPGPALIAWVAAAALGITLITPWLAARLWTFGQLPGLSLPFVLVSWAFVISGRADVLGGVSAAALTPGAATVFHPAVDGFLIELGWLFLVPYPLAGALLFAGLACASRYLALLAVAGYAAGYATLAALGYPQPHQLGFNNMLTAMALGGIFAIPGRASFALALAGGATSAWLVAVAPQPLHLPALTLPFILGVHLWLGGLGSAARTRSPFLLLDRPGMPETTYEGSRLAAARLGSLDSVPLAIPFHGEWRVSQGFNGPHTHQAPWQHALDFDIAHETSTHEERVAGPESFFCFGTPVVAPADGQVVAVQGDLPDMAPGEADTHNNWGNHVLIRTVAGHFVLLAHLKRGSVAVRAGEWVASGQSLGACGSSGRAPEPHLHLQVQNEAPLGSRTRPFHLVNVLVRSEGAEEFRLTHLPREGERVRAAPRDDLLAGAMRLVPGTELEFRLQREGASDGQVLALRVERTLFGQVRLQGKAGASAACEETPCVVGFYDRAGPPDRLLDLWLLALGLTPLNANASRWQDRPSMRLLPLGPPARLVRSLLHPLGAGCDSVYTRTRVAAEGGWLQQGEHRLSMLPGRAWVARTSALVRPAGVERLELVMGPERWVAERTH